MNGERVEARLKKILAAGQSKKLDGNAFQEIAIASMLATILEDRPLNNVPREPYWARTELSCCEEYVWEETHQETHLKTLRKA